MANSAFKSPNTEIFFTMERGVGLGSLNDNIMRLTPKPPFPVWNQNPRQHLLLFELFFKVINLLNIVIMQLLQLLFRLIYHTYNNNNNNIAYIFNNHYHFKQP